MSALPIVLKSKSFCFSCLRKNIIILFFILLITLNNVNSLIIKRTIPGNNEIAQPRAGIELDAYDEMSDDELDEEYIELNVTAEKWKYLGSPCDSTCNPVLQHVHCDPESKFCECEKLYPVQLGPTKGCAKPKKLGEQCLYRATCLYTDQHSTCTQVQHNAVCECEAGYHRVALSRPNKKLFCAADLVLIATDLPTLLGVASGIAVLTGLICFVLKLFSRSRYTRPRHYANAGHAPAAMLFSSDTGIPLTLHGCRPSSRSSQRSSGGTINCVLTRKQSSSGGGGGGGSGNNDGARGPLVSQSRAGAARAAAILLISCRGQATSGNTGNSNGSTTGTGKHRRALSDVAEASPDGLGSRRPSLASIHSSTSSAKSYSARRLERERNEKEQRQALTELKLKREQQQQQLQLQQQQQQQPAPTPSPRTPHSTDELLPSVEEATEIFYNNEIATTSGTQSIAIQHGEPSRTTTTAMIATTSEATSPLFEHDVKPCTSADIYRTQ